MHPVRIFRKQVYLAISAVNRTSACKTGRRPVCFVSAGRMLDIRLASEHAKVGFVFNKIGITPEACSSWFLPRIVGISQALEWTYTAEILSPAALLEGRFVKAVVPAEELLESAYKIARKICQHSPVAIAMTRQMMYRNSAQADPLEAHKVDSLAIFYASQKSGKEGVQSFLEKRPAVFSDTVSKDMPLSRFKAM